MQDTFITYTAVVVDVDIWVKQTIITYFHAVSNKSMRINLGVISNYGIFTDIGKSTNIYILTNLGTGGDKC